MGFTTFAVGLPTQDFVRECYRVYLDRPVESQTSLDHWSKETETHGRTWVANWISHCPEAQEKLKTCSPEFFVQRCYLDSLDRFPESEGLQYWVKRVKEDGKDRVASEINDSVEARGRRPKPTVYPPNPKDDW